ncbi:hypothetical protein F0249_04805 [Vibrio sp. 03-59-1]|nr:hypothetical protein [Vibrio sp. 03-59-1]
MILEYFFQLFVLFSYFITFLGITAFFIRKPLKKVKEFPISAVIKSNFERTTWFFETSKTATTKNQLEKLPWQLM